MLQEDEADEEDDTETPHSMARRGPQRCPSAERQERAGTIHRQRPTNTPWDNTPLSCRLGRSTAAGGMASDAERSSILCSARMTVDSGDIRACMYLSQMHRSAVCVFCKACTQAALSPLHQRSAWGSFTGLFRNFNRRYQWNYLPHALRMQTMR